MNGVVKRIERTHAIAAWVGDRERLERIVRILQALVEKGKTARSDAGDPGGLELVATATEKGSVTIRGEPASVFSEMDRSALLKLELEVTDPSPTTKRDVVRVILDKEKGITLESRGETAWIDEFHASLSEELDRGRPGWVGLRGRQGATIIALLAFTELAMLMWSSSFGEDDGIGMKIFGVVFLGGVGALVVTMVIGKPFARYFLGSRSSSRGKGVGAPRRWR